MLIEIIFTIFFGLVVIIGTIFKIKNIGSILPKNENNYNKRKNKLKDYYSRK